VDDSREWRWLKGGILTSLLSVVTYFIFSAITERHDAFGITAGFGCMTAAFGKLFTGLCDNSAILRFGNQLNAFIEFFTLIGLIVVGFTATKLSKMFSLEWNSAAWQKYHGNSAFKADRRSDGQSASDRHHFIRRGR